MVKVPGLCEEDSRAGEDLPGALQSAHTSPLCTFRDILRGEEGITF